MKEQTNQELRALKKIKTGNSVFIASCFSNNRKLLKGTKYQIFTIDHRLIPVQRRTKYPWLGQCSFTTFITNHSPLTESDD
jgi:hypothetical protein